MPGPDCPVDIIEERCFGILLLTKGPSGRIATARTEHVLNIRQRGREKTHETVLWKSTAQAQRPYTKAVHRRVNARAPNTHVSSRLFVMCLGE